MRKNLPKNQSLNFSGIPSPLSPTVTGMDPSCLETLTSTESLREEHLMVFDRRLEFTAPDGRH